LIVNASLGIATVCAAFLALGCQSRATPTAAISWQILDSAWAPSWDQMNDSLAVYRVAVTRGRQTDTLNNLIGPWPIPVGDSALVGLQLSRADNTRQLFEYRPDGRRLRTHILPADLLVNFTDIAVSPDGRFLAYVADDNGPVAVVRALKGLIVLRGSVQGGCDCDVDLNHARWVTADSFEIAVVNRANLTGGPLWVLAAGSVRGHRLRELGLSSEPTWHEGSRP
jgi:hypothetical protein